MHIHTGVPQTFPNHLPKFGAALGPKLTKVSLVRKYFAKGKNPWISPIPLGVGSPTNYPHPLTATAQGACGPQADLR